MTAKPGDEQQQDMMNDALFQQLESQYGFYQYEQRCHTMKSWSSTRYRERAREQARCLRERASR